MEKEKLIIKDFGPIKSVELDLGRFNILIGEQATGKSTVAKVLAVCRYFSYIIEDDDVYFNQQFEEGLTAWGLTEAIQENTYIFYSCKHYSFSSQRIITISPSADREGNVNEEKVPVFSSKITPISQEFKTLLNELNKIEPPDPVGSDYENISWTIPYSFFLNDVKKVMDNPFYLPTQRGLQSIFSLGQGSLPNLADFLFKYYSKVDGIFRSFKTETEIEPLDIIYINRNGVGYIKKKGEDNFYLLANAASGYQSAIPIALVMKYYERQKRKKTLLIEEPEQNLFPSAQEKLMKYLVHQTMNFGNCILLTTQSPYIQTSVNNMMYAYQVGQKNPAKTSGVVDKKYWLNPDEVSAYRMLSDGTAKNIIDDELKQIDAGEIDEVSRVINDEWDQLANIEYNKANED